MWKSLFEAYKEKLLELKLCYRCTRRLRLQQNRTPISPDTELVVCKCGANYHYDRMHRAYHAVNNRRNFYFDS